MQRFSQSPTDPLFVQDPYPFYDRLRAAGQLAWWDDYGMAVSARYATVNAILRDRRFGRECPAEFAKAPPEHLKPFYAVEDHSMLELDGARHRRLRGLVLRAFTTRRIAGLEPEIEALCHQLLDAIPEGDWDLLPAYAAKLPVIIISRLLGVPEEMADQLLHWSNAMVSVYQAGRTRADEEAAARAAQEFSDFIRSYAEKRRSDPRDDLISELLAAEEDGVTLSLDELVTTCILLLNAGHEATVHTLGNGTLALLRHFEAGGDRACLAPGAIEATVEEILRHDPPLHIFTRYAQEEVEIAGHVFARGDRVACLLGAAGRDPDRWEAPAAFRPDRPVQPHVAFGAGAHFCLGAPLARMELQIGLQVLLARRPGLRLSATPAFADLYHFHGLTALPVHG